MAFKFIALFALVAVASAQHYNNYNNDYYHSNNYDNHHYAAPAAIVKTVQPAIVKTVQPAIVKKIVEHEEPANYEFNYDVHDSHTGDIKQQHEVAHNGAIQGEYSLIDADGYRRVVSYTADDHHGFIANVRREPLGHQEKYVAPVVQKAIVAQPVTKVIAQPAIAVQKYAVPVQKYSAPVQYSAPQYVAPVQKYAQYSAPQYVQQKYVAPVVQKVAVPVVQKYIQPAPVVEKYLSAPVVQQYSAPQYVQKVAVAPAPQYVQKAVVAQPIKYTSAEHSAHVSVNAPGVNYHY